MPRCPRDGDSNMRFVFMTDVWRVACLYSGSQQRRTAEVRGQFRIGDSITGTSTTASRTAAAAQLAAVPADAAERFRCPAASQSAHTSAAAAAAAAAATAAATAGITVGSLLDSSALHRWKWISASWVIDRLTHDVDITVQ